MPTLQLDVPINYVDEGAGPPVVLVHGFASNLQGNWRAPGIIDALVGAGRRVVALDCRGHGHSGKPHDPAAYAGTRMSDDVIALIDHLGLAQVDLVGYSMGGLLSARLLVQHPERFRSVVLAGIGNAVLVGLPRERAEAIARAMAAGDGGASETALARGFRIFAERSGNDLRALAAMQQSSSTRHGAVNFDGVRCPVLVVIGDADTVAGKADRLAAAIPGAKLVVVPGDHLQAVGAPELKRAIVDFLAEHSPA
jgi:pimeloyl-ACP methyl ester carboxylesterase